MDAFMKIDDVCGSIKARGGRLTKIRREIITVLYEEGCLLSSIDITRVLKTKEIVPNRSTIYRELLFLVEKGVIVKSDIAGIERFELPKDHHHHLICLGCREITRIEMDSHFEEEEHHIEKKNKFEIVRHSLEFYGYCKKCKATA